MITVSRAPTEDVAVRAKVGWGGLFRLTLRQHRALIPATAALVLIGVLAYVGVADQVSAIVPGRPRAGYPVVGDLTPYGPPLLTALSGYAGFIAAFWAAPLVSQEYETGTFALAWGQDVRPGRWLAGKVLTLGTLAVLFAVALGLAARGLAYQFEMQAHSHYPAFFDAFEADPLVQVGYTVFGFALGLAASVLTRRTVLAVAVTVVGFAAVRFAVSLWRPYFLPPVRVTGTNGQGFSLYKEVGQSQPVRSGYLDAAGGEVGYPGVGWFAEYQPPARIPALRLIEFGVFAVLAAVLFAVAWRALSRSVRP